MPVAYPYPADILVDVTVSEYNLAISQGIGTWTQRYTFYYNPTPSLAPCTSGIVDPSSGAPSIGCGTVDDHTIFIGVTPPSSAATRWHISAKFRVDGKGS